MTEIAPSEAPISSLATRPPGPRDRALALGAIGVGLASTLFYSWLAPAVVGDGDSSEFTLVLARDGVAHPPGYPIYVGLGHAFVVALHALGATWAYAANAWSALGGGVAIALLFSLAWRLASANPRVPRSLVGMASLLPVLLFTPNPVWTHHAMLAEVYSWHQAWVFGIALSFTGLMRFLASDQHLPRPGKPARWMPRASAFGLLSGIGLAHHLTSVLILAPLGIALLVALARRPALRGRVLLVTLATALLPLLAYGSVAVKASRTDPAIWFRLQPTLASIIDHVTSAQYHGYLGRFAASPLQRRQLARYVFPFLAPLLALMVVTWRIAARGTERAVLATLLVAAAIQSGFSFVYGVTDPASYFVPALGLTAAALAPLVTSLARNGDRARRAATWACGALLLLTPLATMPWVALAAGRRDVLVKLDQGVRRAWDSIPIERGIVLWGGDLHHRMVGWQAMNGERPDLHLVSPYELAASLPRARFARRFGFDPYGGDTTPFPQPPSERGAVYEAFLDRVARRLERATGQPVVVLSPASETARTPAGGP